MGNKTVTLNRWLDFDLVCCKKCARPHTRATMGHAVLEIQPLDATGKKDAGKPIYAFLDTQGRAYATTLKQIQAYTLDQRTRIFQRQWSRIKPKLRRRWDSRWQVVSSVLTGCASKRVGGRVQGRGRDMDSTKEWHKGKSLKPKRLALAVGRAYRVRVDSVLPYVLVTEKDNAGKDFFPFNRKSQAFGKKAAHLDKGRVVKIGAGSCKIKLGMGGYTRFDLELRNIYALSVYLGVYRQQIAKDVQQLQTIREMERVFKTNRKQTPAVKRAIDAAKTAAERLKKQMAKDHKDLPAFKTVEKFAGSLLSLFKLPDAKGKGLCRFERYLKAGWHQHEGAFGPLFLGGIVLRFLKDTPLAKDTYEQYLKARVFDLDKKFEKRFKVDPNGAPFLALDQTLKEGTLADWANSAGWLHKSLTILTDAFGWFTHHHMAKVATGGPMASFKALRGGLTLSRRLLSPQQVKAISAVMGKEFKAAAAIATSKKLRFAWSPKTLPDQVDDLFKQFHDSSKAGKLPKGLEELPGDLQKSVRDAYGKVGKKFQAELDAGTGGATKARGTGIFRLVASGFFLCTVGAGAFAAGAGVGWTSEPFLRAAVDVIGTAIGLGSDFASAFPEGVSKLWKVGLDEATSSSRLVGASRVLGVIAGVITLALAIYDLSKSIRKGDVRGIVANSLIALGAALSLLGFFLDGTLFGAPAGIVLNIVGFALMIIGSVIEWFRPSDCEAQSYLKALLKKSKDLHRLKDAWAKNRLIKAVNESTSYAEIPITAFIAQPKARIKILSAPKALIGEKVQFAIETFRLKKEDTVTLDVAYGPYTSHGYRRFIRAYRTGYQPNPAGPVTAGVATGPLWDQVHKLFRTAPYVLKREGYIKLRVSGKWTCRGKKVDLLSNDEWTNVPLRHPHKLLEFKTTFWSGQSDGSGKLGKNTDRVRTYSKSGAAYTLSKSAFMFGKLSGDLKRVVSAPGLVTKLKTNVYESDWGGDEEYERSCSGSGISQAELRGSYVWHKFRDEELNELIPSTSEAEKTLQVGFQQWLEFRTKGNVLIGKLKASTDDTKYLHVNRVGAA